MSLIQIPDHIQFLVPYVPGKPIEETQREYKLKRVIKLASNENPLGASPKALLAMKKVMKDVFRYPDANAYYFKKKVSEVLKVSPTSIIAGNGSNDVIDLLIRTLCNQGDAIVTSQAAFVAYRVCAQVAGVNTIEASIGEDLKFNLDAILKLLKQHERAKIVFIPNPNNPTGTYNTTSEMKNFLKEVSKVRGGSVVVALDYAYWEYVTAKDLPDPMELLREYPNVVVMRTFSKVYGLAGLRVGYGVGDPELIKTMEKVRQPFNMNNLALAGAEASLSDQAFVKRSVAANNAGMKFWKKGLQSLSIPYWESQGNFILADVNRGLGKSGHDVYMACLKHGVIFRPVTNYGLKHALRISIGTPAENKIALQALKMEAKTKGCI